MNRKFQQSLSLQKKLDILNDIDSKKLKQIEIANKYNIAKSTVSMILKNRQKIETACMLKKFEPSRKRMRTARDDDLDVALIRWMNNAKEQNLPITGPILQEKARSFANAFGATHFLGSTGWLKRFKFRHGFIPKEICDEKCPKNGDMLENFIQLKLQTILNRYLEADIFNMTATSLLWKVLPSQTLKGTICCCEKCSKERLTLLIACNMAGTEKLPLLVIGNTSKPRCFTGIKTLPVTYVSNKKALITADLFRKWLIQLDTTFEKEGRNICFILDSNCGGTYSDISGLKAIQIEFLPFSPTTKLHPCNQGIIKYIKTYYRREILCQAIFSFNQGMSFSINLLDALNILRIAWQEVSSHAIKNCFKKAGFSSKEIFLNPVKEEELAFDSSEAKACGVLPEDVTFEQYVSMDDEVMTSVAVTDDEIISEIKYEEDTTSIDNLHHSSETEDDDDSSDFYNVTTTEAFYALKTIRQFVMQAENSNELLDAVDKLDDMWKQTVGDKN